MLMCLITHSWLWVKKGYPKNTIGKKKNEQKLRSLGLFFLTRSRMNIVLTLTQHDHDETSLALDITWSDKTTSRNSNRVFGCVSGSNNSLLDPLVGGSRM